MLCKQCAKLFLHADLCMMRLLVRNVADDRILLFRTVCEGGISPPPPLKTREKRVVFQPFPCRCLQLPHEVGQRQLGAQLHEQMEMVRHAAYAVEDALLLLHKSPDILVKYFFMFDNDGRNVEFRPEYDVIEQSRVAQFSSLICYSGAPRALFHGGIPPQATRHYGRLPAVKHDSALRAVSLRDD